MDNEEDVEDHHQGIITPVAEEVSAERVQEGELREIHGTAVDHMDEYDFTEEDVTASGNLNILTRPTGSRRSPQRYTGSTVVALRHTSRRLRLRRVVEHVPVTSQLGI